MLLQIAKASARTLAGVLTPVCLLVSCESESDRGRKGARSPSDDDFPAKVQVSAAVTTEGFAFGTLRKTRSVAAFDITTHPVTEAEFARCVEAGACDEPDAEGCLRPPYPRGEADDQGAFTAACVGASQAADYCDWLGGRLPNLSEWLLASRGPNVRRFPWGDDGPSCLQHPRGAPSAAEPCPSGSPFAVGQRPSSASPSRVQDVLLIGGELLSVDPDPLLPACGEANAGCIVHGTHPASIDYVEPIARKPAPARNPYAFRCVWLVSEEGK